MRDGPRQLQPGNNEHEHAEQPVLLEVLAGYREVNDRGGDADDAQAVPEDLAAGYGLISSGRMARHCPRTSWLLLRIPRL